MHKWLTKAQVAEKLGVHPNTIYRLEKRPDFPPRSDALGNPRWRDDEIEKFMREYRRCARHAGGFEVLDEVARSRDDMNDARRF